MKISSKGEENGGVSSPYTSKKGGVSHECGKDEAEVKRYYVAFWTHYQRFVEWKRIMERVEKGE